MSAYPQERTLGDVIGISPKGQEPKQSQNSKRQWQLNMNGSSAELGKNCYPVPEIKFSFEYPD
jgi:hypothetical protein